jgi:hypothetical protein
MGRKPGVQNVSKDEAQKRVLAQLEQGLTITDAMRTVGRNDTTFRQWVMNSPEFKEASDKARLAGKGFKADLQNLKDISYEDFCQQFLNTKIFPHQRNWIELIEGKDPSWLHPSMVYEKASEKRILINVPPEHAKSTTITSNYVTWKIVTNPNSRVIIVSKTQAMARKFLGQIKGQTNPP